MQHKVIDIEGTFLTSAIHRDNRVQPPPRASKGLRYVCELEDKYREASSCTQKVYEAQLDAALR